MKNADAVLRAESLELTAESLAFKDHEDDASQLNRLGVAYFLVDYFRFLPPYFGFAFLFRSAKRTCFA